MRERVKGIDPLLVCLLVLLAGAQAAPAQEAREITLGLPFYLSVLRDRRIELFLPREITIDMSFDLAVAALQAAGAREGHAFDAIDLSPPPKWMDFALPDRRVVTLHGAASDLFPADFYVTRIFVTYPSVEDLGALKLKADRKQERVEKFPLP